MRDPRAIALGDQIHAEITDRANEAFRAQFAEEGVPLSPDADEVIQIGVQAGLQTALQVMWEKGWLRLP
jgi:hypothetical protein